MPVHIAIDGPVGAGKSTVSRLVAQRLGFFYVDTGAMYRTTALLASRLNIPLQDQDKIVDALSKVKIEMRNPLPAELDGRTITIFLDGEDISHQIRTPDVSMNASAVASLAKVREYLVIKQQEIAANQDVIMEGRDITYRVLPHAQLKIYLNASPEHRAERKHSQMIEKGQAQLETTYESVLAETIARDQQDMTRATDPLKIVPDAWKLDTDTLTINQVVDTIVEKIQSLPEMKK
jgi:cytidylate kinase